jgi:cell wall-associated NlpC family hydrolase
VAAEPPLNISEARAQIAQLQTDAAALDQEYVAVKEQFDEGRGKLESKQGDVRAQTKKVARMRLQVEQAALAQYQSRSLETTAQLFLTSDSDGFLSQISTVEKVSENQNAVLQDFQAEQAALAELERSAETDVKALAVQTADLTRLRAASDRKLTESRTVLARLTKEEQRRIAAEEAKAAAAGRAAAVAAAKAQADEESGSQKPSADSESASSSSSSATGSSRGAKAVAFARSQLGKPYRLAATGPSAYDGPGLTSAAWAAAGVSLPRSSRSQFGAGRSVSRSELQPGDLVFFDSPVSQVALYAGNGRLIQSPRPGRSVEYASLSSKPFAGARRPG